MTVGVYIFLITIVTLDFLSVQSASQADPVDGQRYPPLTSNAKISLSVNLCSSNVTSPGKVELPLAFANEAGHVDYILVGLTLKRNTARGICHNETSTRSISVSKYYELLPQVEEKVNIQLNNTLVWANGYLSVGTKKDIYYYPPQEYCLHESSGQGDKTVTTFKICNDFIKGRTILTKCCPPGQIVDTNIGCVNMSESGKETFQPDFFDQDKWQVTPYSKVNPVIRYELLNCTNSTKNNTYEPWLNDGCDEQRPALNGRLAYIGAHREWAFLRDYIPYCFDNVLHQGRVQYGAIVCSKNRTADDSGGTTSTSYLYMFSMYVGAFFHFLTALVYGITWGRQNIHGKTLFSCTLSLFAMKVMMGNAHLMGLMQVTEFNKACIANAILAQYFMLACFTWLLIVNTDLWYTFSTIRADTGPAFKRFLGYSSFGWGLPLVVTVISVILNFQFPCRSSKVVVPEYGKRICFVAPWAQGYYIYYILGILMALTCILAVLTLKVVYSVKRKSTKLRTNQEDKNIFILFVKLSVIMGFSWIFEVISWAATKEEDGNSVVWIIFDVYNALSGILIFIIFVCKRSTLTLLEQTHPMFKGVTGAFTNLVSAFTSTKEPTSSGATSSTGLMTGEAERPARRYD